MAIAQRLEVLLTPRGVESTARSMARADAGAERLHASLRDVTRQARASAAAGDSMGSSWLSAGSKLGNVATGLQSVVSMTRDVVSQFHELAQAGAQANLMVKNFTGDLGALKRAVAGTIDETSLQIYHETATSMGLTSAEAEGLAKKMLASSLANRGMIVSLDDLRMAVKGEAESLAAMGIKVDLAAAKYKGLSESAKKLQIVRELAAEGTQIQADSLRNEVTQLAQAEAAWDNMMSTLSQALSSAIASSGGLDMVEGVLKDLSSAAAELIPQIVDLAKSALPGLTAVAKALTAALDLMVPVLEAALWTYDLMSTPIQYVTEELLDFSRGVFDVTTVSEHAQGILKAVHDALWGEADAAKGAKQEIDALAKATRGLNAANAGMLASMTLQHGMLGAGNRLLNDFRGDVDGLALSLALESENFSDFAAKAGEATSMMAAANQAAFGGTDQASDAAAKLDTLHNAILRVGHAYFQDLEPPATSATKKQVDLWSNVDAAMQGARATLWSIQDAYRSIAAEMKFSLDLQSRTKAAYADIMGTIGSSRRDIAAFYLDQERADRAKALQDYQDDVADSVSTMNAAAGTASGLMTTAFSDFMSGTASMGDAMLGALSGLLGAVQPVLLEMATTFVAMQSGNPIAAVIAAGAMGAAIGALQGLIKGSKGSKAPAKVARPTPTKLATPGKTDKAATKETLIVQLQVDGRNLGEAAARGLWRSKRAGAQVTIPADVISSARRSYP